MDTTLKRILDIFLDNKNEYLTSDVLAKIMKLSEKTIRNNLKTLQKESVNYGAEIESKRGVGYKFKIYKNDVFYDWYELYSFKNEFIPTIPAERIHYLLAYLLGKSKYTKIQDITEILYVSRNTVSNDLKKVEEILNKFNLGIERRPNYGIRISGNELDKRKCILEYIYKNNSPLAMDNELKKNSDEIVRIIIEIVRNNNLKMSETSFETLILIVYIMTIRIDEGHTIEYSEQTKKELEQLIDERIMKISKDLCLIMTDNLKLTFSKDEVLYLALNLSGKTASSSQLDISPNHIISKRLDNILEEMLGAVYDSLLLDFRDDLELRMSLYQHLIPMDIRLKYDIPTKNPKKEYIKSEYVLAYSAGIIASSVLSKHYNKEVSEDEIAYIASFFALSILNKDLPQRKYNIVVVCASGKGTAQLFLHKFKKTFGNYIDNVYDFSIFDLENFDFEKYNIDFIFTTIPINIQSSIPIFEISLLLSSDEIQYYQNVFQKGDDYFIEEYFKEELFIPTLKANSKEEALKKIIEFAESKVNLPDNIYDLVFVREEMGQTDFGNLVAIPHPSRVLNNKTLIITAILEEPIWWGHNDVQVIFLVSFSKNKEINIDQFYEVLVNYLSNLSLVENTIADRSFSNLINQLKIAFRE